MIEQKIWNFFISKGCTQSAAAGIMGNLYAESGLINNNIQNSYEKKIKMNDETYTKAVDEGVYTNFVYDGIGYGLCQFTFWSLKKELLEAAKANSVSISDPDIQLQCMWNNFSEKLKTILFTTSSVEEASIAVLTMFERPKDQSQEVKNRRIKYALIYYNKFFREENKRMLNSPLITYEKICDKKTVLSNKEIKRITIHCYVGQVTAKQGVDYFYNTDRQASSNYVVGRDGSIGLSVDEKDRAWTSSSRANDEQAITIETACDTTYPYIVNQIAYTALLNLIEDICKRYNKTKIIWINDKDSSLKYNPSKDEILLTVHRWFASTACPGDYLFGKMSEIANEITNRLQKEDEEEMTQEKFNEMMNVWLAETAKKEPNDWSSSARNWAELNNFVQSQDFYQKPLTREELVTVLYRIYNVDDSKVSKWSKEAREWAEKQKIVEGTGSEMGYKHYVTKEEVITILYRFKEMLNK